MIDPWPRVLLPLPYTPGPLARFVGDVLQVPSPRFVFLCLWCYALLC